MEYVGDIVPKITWETFNYRQIPMNLLVGQSFPIAMSKFGDDEDPWLSSIGTMDLVGGEKLRFPELPPVRVESVKEEPDQPAGGSD